MLPQEIIIPGMEELTSETFKADFEKCKLKGKINELEAVKQAVFLILKTEYEYSEVYSGYGIKTIDLIGQDFDFAISELKRRITEALMTDDRIENVNGFEFNQNEDILNVKFVVKCKYGEFASGEEVML